MAQYSADGMAEIRRDMHRIVKKVCGEGRPCPACGNKVFTATLLLELPILYIEGQPRQAPEGSVMPVLPLVCSKCSYMRMFSFYSLLDAEKEVDGQVKSQHNEGEI